MCGKVREAIVESFHTGGNWSESTAPSKGQLLQCVEGADTFYPTRIFNKLATMDLKCQ